MNNTPAQLHTIKIPAIRLPELNIRLPHPPALTHFSARTLLWAYTWSAVFCLSVWLEPIGPVLFLPMLITAMCALGAQELLPIRFRGFFTLCFTIGVGSVLGTFIEFSKPAGALSLFTEKTVFVASFLTTLQYARLKQTYARQWIHPDKPATGQNIILWLWAFGIGLLVTMIPKMLAMLTHFYVPPLCLIVISLSLLMLIPYLACLSLQDQWPCAVPNNPNILTPILRQAWLELWQKECPEVKNLGIQFSAWFREARNWDSQYIRTPWACAGSAITGLDSPAVSISRPVMAKLVGSSKLTLTDLLLLFCAGGLVGALSLGNILLLQQGLVIDTRQLISSTVIHKAVGSTGAILAMMSTIAHSSYYLSLFYTGISAITLRNGNLSNAKNKFLIAISLALVPALVELFFWIAPKFTVFVH